MSTLQTKGFSTIVGTIAAGMQGRVSSRFLNFAFGSMLRALAEAYAGILLWFQKLALDVAKLTRLRTSFGQDADDFIADFPLITRFGAEAATGTCTFSRFTASPSPVIVPVGGLVKTGDGLQTFQVVADTANASFVASYSLLGTATPIGGYAMPPQIGSVVVPVQSITNGTTGLPGSNGNVAANTISLIASNMPGVDSVSNPNAITNGIDSESDEDLKARFQLAILGRSGGTRYAIQSAVANVKAGMQCQILEFQDYSGNFDPVMNTVIVDDGSGAIPDDLLNACITAVSDSDVGARACGIQVGVYRATTTLVNIIMQVQTAAGYDHNVALAQLDQALSLFINSLGLGAGVGYFDLPDVAKSVSGITRVLSYTLNGGTTDISPSPYTTLKIGQATLS